MSHIARMYELYETLFILPHISCARDALHSYDFQRHIVALPSQSRKSAMSVSVYSLHNQILGHDHPEVMNRLRNKPPRMQSRPNCRKARQHGCETKASHDLAPLNPTPKPTRCTCVNIENLYLQRGRMGHRRSILTE